MDVTTQAVTQEELPKVFKVLDKEPETAAIILKGHGIVARIVQCSESRADRRTVEEYRHDCVGTEKTQKVK